MRAWDIIPDFKTIDWAQTHDVITSICFSPDGRTVAGGLIQGQVYFYDFEGMKYRTRMNVRNRNGKYKSGTKVTGMSFINSQFGSMQSSGQLLVTTNDSRIRLCRLQNYSIVSKCKGLSNTSMQIRANASEDGRFVISGSDSGAVYIWRTPDQSKKASLFSSSDVIKNGEYEMFENTRTQSSLATICAVFSPVR